MRLLFLMHSWSSTMDYKETSMKESIAFETLLINLFNDLEALIRSNQSFIDNSVGINYFNDPEKVLSAK